MHYNENQAVEDHEEVMGCVEADLHIAGCQEVALHLAGDEYRCRSQWKDLVAMTVAEAGFMITPRLTCLTV